MAKVDIEIVQKVLKERGVDMRLAAEILHQIREVAAEETEKREKPLKKQWLMLASEPEEGLPKDLTGWVVQLPEDNDAENVADKLIEVAKAYNASSRGQRAPVDTIGEAIEGIPSKHYRENDLWIKTRQPVRIIALKNSLGKRRRD